MTTLRPIALNCPREGLQYVLDTDPILAIPHDDMPDPLAPFAGKNVIMWRCMSPRSQLYRALPQKAHVVGANENEEDWPSWYVGWLAEVRVNRPDLIIHHPPANTQGQFPVDPAALAICDVLDVHVATFWSSDQMRTWAGNPGKPWWATEVEADPLDPSQMDLLMDGAKAALAAGAEMACLWGARQDFPDVLFHPEILAAVRQFNAGDTNVAGTIEDRVAALEQRDADLVAAIHDMLLGKYTGADGAAGQIVALQGGTDDLSGKVKVPTFS